MASGWLRIRSAQRASDGSRRTTLEAPGSGGLTSVTSHAWPHCITHARLLQIWLRYSPEANVHARPVSSRMRNRLHRDHASGWLPKGIRESMPGQIGGQLVRELEAV